MHSLADKFGKCVEAGDSKEKCEQGENAKYCEFESRACRACNLPKRSERAKQFPGEEKAHTNFLLWLTSRWPWDKRLVVPGLTGPKSLCVRLKTQEI